ncbi:SAM-dependent methyltransferase [Amycolatopsis sp. NPDC051758]|uniref:SAM-dependent methyltransferase n=1 Tax=Amycolatopsis sp. NPDC051758 TaxID=3363935 RepID=UPI00379E321A
MWTAPAPSGSRRRCGTAPTRPAPGWTELTRTARPSARVDFDRPSSARVFDALMGGQDNYEVDRVVLREILEIAPAARR